MSAAEPEQPRELVTRAEYERRLKRAWRWWWAGILFFGGGAASMAALTVVQRQQFDATSLGGAVLVILFALERIVFMLRRRPH